MSADALSALEQNIRDRSETETVRSFSEDWHRAFYWKPMITLSKEEGEAISAVRDRLLAVAKKKAGDAAVGQFISTYRNLIHQFPDLIDPGEQKGAA